jgi:hypothetical protein
MMFMTMTMMVMMMMMTMMTMMMMMKNKQHTQLPARSSENQDQRWSSVTSELRKTTRSWHRSKVSCRASSGDDCRLTSMLLSANQSIRQCEKRRG